MTSFEVRDNRAGFLWINNEIVDHYAKKIGPSAFLVYAVLAKFANNSNQESFPSQTLIAKIAGMSDRAVRTALGVLRDEKLISWDQVTGKPGRHHTYVMLKPEKSSGSTGTLVPVQAANNSGSTGSLLPTNKTKEQDERTRAIEWLGSQYQTIFSKKLWTLTDLRRKKALARLDECLVKTNGSLNHAVGMLLMAMRALRASDFHMGKNDRNTQYIDWEKNLFKSQEITENWIAKGIPIAEQRAKAPVAIDALQQMRARRAAKSGS